MKCKYLVSFALLFCALLISFSSIADSYGHGLGSEVLPPELIGSKMVTLEISSHPIPDTDTREIYFSLYETDTGITVKDVTYSITAEKENKLLFDETFQSDDGIVVLKLIPTESQQISVEEQSVDFFSCNRICYIFYCNPSISFVQTEVDLSCICIRNGMR